MSIRTRAKTVIFSRPFSLKGVDRVLPAGDYRVLTDEELVEGLVGVERADYIVAIAPGVFAQPIALEAFAF